MTPADFEAIAALLRARSGLAIGPDKQYLLEARLMPVMRGRGLCDLAALAAALRPPANEALAQDVVEAMTTNESFFFRDEKPFLHFRDSALPRLHGARESSAPIRVWSAAASTGQEAYSLAMIVAERAALLGPRRVEILATDIAREPLARARAGLYSEFEVQRGLPSAMLRHFHREEAGWRIARPLREAVRFEHWNLLSDPRPLGVFDVVFCRNVLIYFDAPTKTRVLAAIARQMAPDGVLYLGGAETVLGVTDCLAPIPGEHGVYAPCPPAAGKPAALPSVTPCAATAQTYRSSTYRSSTYRASPARAPVHQP